MTGLSSATERREFVMLLNSKAHSSPELYRAGEKLLREVEGLQAAFRQACTNLATVRPVGGSLGEDAEAWAQALLAGEVAP